MGSDGGSETPSNVLVVPSEKLVFSAPQASEDGGGEGLAARAHLVIHNPTDNSVIYKFKTNASKAQVGVSPCVGHIHPGEHADIAVNLNYADQSALDNLKVLVVTAPAPQFDNDLKTVWKGIAAQDQSITKVRCVVNKLAPALMGNLGDGLACAPQPQMQVQACAPPQAFTSYVQAQPSQVSCAPVPPSVCPPAPIQQPPPCPPPQQAALPPPPPPQKLMVCPQPKPPPPQEVCQPPVLTAVMESREPTEPPPPQQHIPCVSRDTCPSCSPAPVEKPPCAVEERKLTPSKICFTQPQQLYQQPCQPPPPVQTSRVCPPPPPPQATRPCPPAPPPPPQPEQQLTCTPPEASFTPPQVSCTPPEASCTPPQASCVPTMSPQPLQAMAQPCPPPPPPQQPKPCVTAPPPAQCPQPPPATKVETCTSSQRVPQPLQNFEKSGQTACEATTGAARTLAQPTMYHTVLEDNIVPQPTSYFVDVTPIAERERSSAAGETWSVDRNNIMQICLMAAAGIAAAKLFFE